MMGFATLVLSLCVYSCRKLSYANDGCWSASLPESGHAGMAGCGRVLTTGRCCVSQMGPELLCISALGCESGKVNFSGCCTASLLALPAIPAKHSLGPDVPLGALVPPFLLELSPNL